MKDNIFHSGGNMLMQCFMRSKVITSQTNEAKEKKMKRG